MVDRGRTITPSTPAEIVHELRKDAKKLRYLIECFGGLYDKSARTAFVSRLKALQDTLGEHQDAEVHAHALRTIADDPQRRWSADTLLAIGQLVERLEQRRLASRNELAERFARLRPEGDEKGVEGVAGERWVWAVLKVLATYSIKGGVGKTTTAVNLSFEAASTGARVLLWDLDPQGAATFFFRVKPRVKGGVARLLGRRGELAANIKESDVGGLHLVPADFSLRHLDVHLADGSSSTSSLAALLEPLADDYDVGILDCAPGITLGSEAVFSAADVLLVPTVPTTLSVRTLDQLTGFLAESGDGPEVLPFVSMLDRRKSLHRELIESLADVEPPFLTTAIPNASAVERMAVHRAPLGEVAPRSVARRAFADLWAEVAAEALARLIGVFAATGVLRADTSRRKHSDQLAIVDEGHGRGDEAEEEHQADADDRDDVWLEVGEVGVADRQSDRLIGLLGRRRQHQPAGADRAADGQTEAVAAHEQEAEHAAQQQQPELHEAGGEPRRRHVGTRRSTS